VISALVIGYALVSTDGQDLTAQREACGADRLERGDYVRRERDTKDRRKILVVPEEEGRQRLAQHYAGYGEHMQRVLSRLTPRQLQTIAEFLDAMTDIDGGYIAHPHRSDTPKIRPVAAT
jgi:hypothetical protein